MRRTKEEAEVTRLALIKAGLKLFSEKGYAGTRLEEIAHEAGVTRGAIYHHFGSKMELYLALFQLWERIDPIAEQEIAKSGTWLDKFRRMFIRFLEYIEEDDEFRAMLELSYQAPQVNDDERPMLEAGVAMKRYAINDALEQIAALFGKAKEQGEVREDLDIDIAAQAYMGMYGGLAQLWLINRKKFSLKENAIPLVDIFMRGIMK